MVQSVSVVVPASLYMPPPELVAALPLMVQSVSVAVPLFEQAAAITAGGVAADGAVGQRHRVPSLSQAAAFR